VSKSILTGYFERMFGIGLSFLFVVIGIALHRCLGNGLEDKK
jgi:hypothetical protein